MLLFLIVPSACHLLLTSLYICFFSPFLSVFLVAVMNFRYLFFSFSDATRGSAVKRFSISFARHPTNGTFCFYFNRYSPASSFFIFLLFQNLKYTVSFVYPSLISIGIQFQLISPKVLILCRSLFQL